MSTTLLPLALAYEGDLTGSAKLVLIYLCDLSNDGRGNYAWPSHQSLYNSPIVFTLALAPKLIKIIVSDKMISLKI